MDTTSRIISRIKTTDDYIRFCYLLDHNLESELSEMLGVYSPFLDIHCREALEVLKGVFLDD